MQRTTDFWVGDRVVRPSLGEIRLGIERVRLEPRSMQVLLALADKAPEVVLKQDLIDEVWGEKFVSDEVLTHAIWDLRRAFGDQATNPEFIQTIPKRGYRLIAPVKEIGSETGDDAAPARSARLQLTLLGILAVLALGAASVWLGRGNSPQESVESGNPPPAERASLSGRRSELPPIELTLTPPRRDGAPGVLLGRLDELQAALAGLPPDIQVLRHELCPPRPGDENQYCLTSRLQKQGDGYRVLAQVEKTASSRTVYSVSEDLADLADLEAAAAQLAELISIYFEVVRTWDIRDPDIEPWVSPRDHDVRAIRDFLHGREMVLTNEVGARTPFQAAMDLDPTFIAPRIWRTPTLVSEGNAETLASHKTVLLGLYKGADPFEKAVLLWAVALIEGKLAEQLRHLKSAHRYEPENRPVRVLLGATTYAFGDLTETWTVLEPLLQEQWCYPPLYPLAATCALDRGRIEDARRVLALALRCEPIEPGSLDLLRILAVYDDDADAETVYTERLKQREIEMLPEVVEVESSRPAELLAAQAETEDRKEIAARLREFTN